MKRHPTTWSRVILKKPVRLRLVTHRPPRVGLGGLQPRPEDAAPGSPDLPSPARPSGSPGPRAPPAAQPSASPEGAERARSDCHTTHTADTSPLPTRAISRKGHLGDAPGAEQGAVRPPPPAPPPQPPSPGNPSAGEDGGRGHGGRGHGGGHPAHRPGAQRGTDPAAARSVNTRRWPASPAPGAGGIGGL